MRRAAWAGALLLATTACGSSVQRATIVPAKEPSAAPAAPQPSSTGDNEQPTATGRPLEIKPASREYIVDTARSHFEVFGKGTVAGEYKMSFRTWEARVYIEPNHPRIKVRVETSSVQMDLVGGTGLVRTKLLESDRFPLARLEATMSRTEGPPEEHLVEGIADLHGIKRGLRFLGTLTQEGEGFRFKTEFILSRKEFDIHYRPIEPFLKDDVRIVVDAIAMPSADAPLPPPK